MARLLCILLLLWTFSEAAGWGRWYPSGCAPPYFLLCRQRDLYSLNVFNGSVHMQSMDFFRAAVLWVLGGHFQITETYIPVERWYPLSGTAQVTHILCLTSSFAHERLFQRHCRTHGIAVIPLVETMVRFLTGLTR